NPAGGLRTRPYGNRVCRTYPDTPPPSPAPAGGGNVRRAVVDDERAGGVRSLVARSSVYQTADNSLHPL
ncbi:hypothetical protein, partial [Chloroflexus sp.]|uniref:hypothetical protein n=1 Tax=Chloroflexus sp. TaxID=1904827 RepID=UPI00404A643A